MNVRRKLIAVALGAGLALTGVTFAGGSAAKPARPAQMYPTTTTTGY